MRPDYTNINSAELLQKVFDSEGFLYNANYVWNPSTLAFELMQQPSLEAPNSNINVNIEDVEQLLTEIKAIQTNKTQFVKITDGTDDVDVLSANGFKGLVVLQPSHLSTLNSSTTPLGANATFTGTAEDVLNYANIQLNVKASHTSATNGLKIQFSPDGTNWDNDDSYTIEAGVGKTFSAQTSGRYFRVVYVNGNTPQTYFRLETIAKPQYTKPSSHRIKDNVSTEDDAELVKAQLVAQMPSGTMTNINSTTGGNLKVSVEESDPNATLIVKPYLIDEFGNTAQMLGDSYFQGSPIVIDVEHHEIHCGDSYRAIRKVDLGNGASDNILITVPNETGTELTQKKYHLTIQLDTELEADYSLYEAPTTTANGTAMTFYNRNRNSAFTTGLTIHHTPTVTADGTLIDGDHWGSGRQVGGSQRGELEWVLKNNTKYLLRITNSTSNNNYISWKIDHYIHPGV